MKAGLALTCTTNVQGFICMAIFTLLMSLCGNVNLLFNSLIILFFRIPDLHNLIFKIFPVDFGFVSHLGAVIVNRTHRTSQETCHFSVVGQFLILVR